jgi:hypothetical protein
MQFQWISYHDIAFKYYREIRSYAHASIATEPVAIAPQHTCQEATKWGSLQMRPGKTLSEFLFSLEKGECKVYIQLVASPYTSKRGKQYTTSGRPYDHHLEYRSLHFLADGGCK